MPLHDRRDFIKLIGGGAIGTALASRVSAQNQGPQIPHPRAQRLMRVLAAHRSQIETLYMKLEDHIIYTSKELDESDRWVSEGIAEMWIRGPLCRTNSYRGDFVFSEIVTLNYYYRTVSSSIEEVDGRVLEEAPISKRSHPDISLDDFLPILRDKPCYGEEVEHIDGKKCYVFMQGDRRFYIDEKLPGVRRLELLSTSTHVSTRVDFQQFEEIEPGLHFPMRVFIVEFSELGEIERLQRDVLEVIVNGEIPEDVILNGVP